MQEEVIEHIDDETIAEETSVPAKPSESAAENESGLSSELREILDSALHCGASVIHLECDSESLNVHFCQFNRWLGNAMRFPPDLWPEIAWAALRKAGWSKDNCGKTRFYLPFPLNGKEYFLRMDTGNPHRFRMRIVPPSAPSADSLSIPNEYLNRAIRELARPAGLFLVASLPNHGRTTLMRSLVQLAAKIHRREVVSLHAEVLPKQNSNPGIASSLRPLSSLDLDSINGVGCEVLIPPQGWENMGSETVNAILDKSFRGCLVIAEIEAPDCATAVKKLLYSGADPDFLSDCLVTTMSQYLAGTVCAVCEEAISEELLQEFLRLAGLKNRLPGDVCPLAEGVGCDTCAGYGLIHRIPLYEMVIWDRTLSAELVKNPTRKELRKIISSQSLGLKDLARKMIEGRKQTLFSFRDLFQLFRL